jgi:hypothetical protein
MRDVSEAECASKYATAEPRPFIKHVHVPEDSSSSVERAHSFSQPAHFGFILFISAGRLHSFDSKHIQTLFIMKFTALTLLALGASTSAYVVPNNKVVEENAVEARMPVRLITCSLARPPLTFR